MDSYIDVGFHIFFSLAAGFIAWKIYGLSNKKNLVIAVLLAILSGVLIDLDHFIDNFLTFGFHFNYDYFIRGEYFLRTGKTYVFFHGFEYVIILAILSFLFKSKKVKMILTALCLAMFFHLIVDILLFSIPIKNYFIPYRIFNGFKVYMISSLIS